MCSSNANSAVMLPFGLKIGGHSPYLGLGTSQLGLELHRARVQEYTQRIQLGMRSYGEQVSAGAGPLSYHSHVASPYMYPYFYKDPRARFIHEEPKPNHSYIGLIAMAILSVRDKKLVLSDIYQWILDNYSYFRTRGPGWRNSIRHNLSLNDCFIKSGRSANGKGHYWAIHPANIDDFQKGDFRRRRAQRRVRKHMGLSVADDEDDDSPVPSPTPVIMNWDAGSEHDKTVSNEENEPANCDNNVLKLNTTNTLKRSSSALVASSARPVKRVKRQFDMASLLAPDVVEETETVSSTILVEDTHEIENAASSGKDSDDGSCENENENKLSDSGESHTANNDHTFQPSDYSNTVSFRETTASETETNHSNIYSSIPHLLSGYQRNADAQQRVSAFRHAGSYNWGQLSGCLPNYIGSGFGQQLSARQFNSESARRLQEAMANLITRNQDDRSMPVNTADD